MQIVCPSCGTKNRVPDQRLGEQPLCGRCGSELMAPAPVALDDRTLGPFLEGTELPVLVDYWAAWCGPCQVMAPQFAQAAARMPKVRFVKVDTEASPAASMRQRVQSIPTLVLFRGGREIARRSGAVSAEQIVAWLKAQLGSAA